MRHFAVEVGITLPPTEPIAPVAGIGGQTRWITEPVPSGLHGSVAVGQSRSESRSLAANLSVVGLSEEGVHLYN